MRMKSFFIMLFLFGIFYISCKEKENSISLVHNCPCSGSVCQSHHPHFYRVYSGLISQSDELRIRTQDTFGLAMFGTDSVFYYNFDSTIISNINTGTPVDVYYLKNNEKLVAISINGGISNQHYYEGKEYMDTPNGIGNFGCVPKFLMNNGDLFSITINNQIYIPLTLAKHIHHEKVIDTLTYYFFAISQSCYDSLNQMLQKDEDLQGGLCSEDLNVLNIYDASGTTHLTSVCNN